MGIVTNVITPIIQLSFYVFFFGGFIFVIYRLIRPKLPHIRLFLKYKVFRREYKDEDVAWCMDAVNSEMDSIKVKEYLLLKGVSVKKTNEMLFIFREVSKRLKGGNKNGKQFRQSNGKDQQIPKIEGKRT